MIGRQSSFVSKPVVMMMNIATNESLTKSETEQVCELLRKAGNLFTGKIISMLLLDTYFRLHIVCFISHDFGVGLNLWEKTTV